VRTVIRRGRLWHAAGQLARRGGGAVLIGVTLAGAPVLAPGSLAKLAGPAPAAASMLAGSEPASTAPAGPANVLALGADLVDARTGATLWSRAASTPRPVASITKVMTALVVLRAGHLDRQITVTRAAVRYVRKHDGTSAGLKAGDVLTARELLNAMLLPSGCDAAFLLASAYAPTQHDFVAQMNARAAALHMYSTHFDNFDGLPMPAENADLSTPADLMLLAKAALARPLFAGIVAQKSRSLPATPRHKAYFWKNTNLLLGSYPGTIGVKTGTTAGAGDCLLFEATRGGRTLLGVVLHANGARVARRFIMASRILNWGFGTPTASFTVPAVPAWANQPNS
jgi:serine-type D-Ala-D-Ala carboxypeptidase (penicillin-binding protein 5/6)